MKRIMVLIIYIVCYFNLFAQTWSPDGTKIAFFYIHSIEDIYLVNPDGSGFEIVDHHPERDFVPQWSPDGKHLIFTSVRDGHHEIYRLTIKNKQVTRLTHTEFESDDGCYFPNGKKILFASNRNGNKELFTMDANGGNVTQVTFTPESFDYSPRISPDGKKIIFVSKMEGEESDLWIMKANGNKRERLTNTPDSEFHASFSNDGRKISYIKFYNNAFEVHVLDLKTREDRILVRKDGYQAFYPHWSPDDQFITFTRDVMEGTAPGLPALFMVDMQGNEKLISDKNSF